MSDFDRYGSFHVTIDRTRWQVYITIDDEREEKPTKFVATADRAFTNGDGIWFGTEAEFDAEMEKL